MVVPFQFALHASSFPFDWVDAEGPEVAPNPPGDTEEAPEGSPGADTSPIWKLCGRGVTRLRSNVLHSELKEEDRRSDLWLSKQ